MPAEQSDRLSSRVAAVGDDIALLVMVVVHLTRSVDPPPVPPLPPLPPAVKRLLPVPTQVPCWSEGTSKRGRPTRSPPAGSSSFELNHHITVMLLFFLSVLCMQGDRCFERDLAIHRRRSRGLHANSSRLFYAVEDQPQHQSDQYQSDDPRHVGCKKQRWCQW